MAPPDLPNPQRRITDSNYDTGVSIYNTSFDESLPVMNNVEGTLFRLAYVSDRAPQSLNGSDLAQYENYLKNLPPLVLPGGGATVWYVETPPGAESPLHRTVSVDFVIHVEGEIQLMLDSGETRLQKPGDIVIQRGTNHRWKNLSTDKWARMVAVMIQIEPITLNNGTQLAGNLPTGDKLV